MRRTLPLLAFLLLAATACGDDAKPATPTATKVTIATAEYRFTLPSTFKGGLVEITLDNTAGAESHEAGLTRIDEGKTLTDFLSADLEGPPPSWAHPSGGPGPVSPGKKAVYTANLQPGHYTLVCFVPARDGAPHYKKGMAAEAQVTAGTSGSLPEAAATIDATEMKFSGADGVRAGSQTVRVNNTGQQVHNVAMFTLAPGKKVADVLAFFGGTAPAGPPPFTDLPGLVATIAPGDSVTRTLELEAGKSYAFVCFMPDTDGAPHFLKGMVAEVAV